MAPSFLPIKKFFKLNFLLFLLVNLCMLNAQEQSVKEKKTGNRVVELSLEGLPAHNLRYQTFKKALKLMNQRGAKIIVETGTTRGINLKDIFAGDGGSTLIFARWAATQQANLYSVDICPTAFTNAAEFLAPYRKHTTCICMDSVAFLENFDQPIDLLYLDSYDFDSHNPIPSQEHHLKEIQAAYPKLTDQTIIMIDDCGLAHGGKGKLVIEFLLNLNWKIVANDYQVILIRE